MSAPAPSGQPQRQLAVFIDFENLALGLRAESSFDIGRILDRLLEKGKVIVKVAYADWLRFRQHTQSLHESGIELIEIPKRSSTGKNSADIRLVVDAMDLSWNKEHIDTFVIVSGDSDFSPLVAKLKENGRHVIGMGMKASTSPLLANGCDEFIYYEDLERAPAAAAVVAGAQPGMTKDDAFRLLVDTVRALKRENFEVLQASLVKDTMKRKRPAFSEAGLGYGSFSELLEDAEGARVVTLRRDERSRTYMVNVPESQGQRAPTTRGPQSRDAQSRDAQPRDSQPRESQPRETQPRESRESSGRESSGREPARREPAPRSSRPAPRAPAPRAPARRRTRDDD